MIKLSGVVLAEDDQGNRVLLSPDDELPEWAARTITNPKAWVGGKVPSATPARRAAKSESD